MRTLAHSSVTKVWNKLGFMQVSGYSHWQQTQLCVHVHGVQSWDQKSLYFLWQLRAFGVNTTYCCPSIVLPLKAWLDMVQQLSMETCQSSPNPVHHEHFFKNSRLFLHSRKSLNIPKSNNHKRSAPILHTVFTQNINCFPQVNVTESQSANSITTRTLSLNSLSKN